MSYKISDKKGFSLIQIVVSLGVFSVMVGTLIQLQLQQLEQVSHLENKLEIMGVKNAMLFAYADSSNCICQLNDAGYTFNSSVEDGTQFIELDDLKLSCSGDKIATPGEKLNNSRNVKVDKIRLTSLKPLASPATNSWSADLEVSFNIDIGKGIAIKPIRIPQIVEINNLGTNNSQVVNCASIGGSSSSTQAFTNVQLFNVPGTFNFTVPSGVTRLKVELWGGGGGGGGGSKRSASSICSGGGGGGAGGYSLGYVNVIEGQVIPLTVGAGGIGGTGRDGGNAGGNGTNGGNSNFLSFQSNGGVGGLGASTSPPTKTGYGQPGGGASGGDVNLTGGHGGSGMYNYISAHSSVAGSGGNAPFGGSSAMNRDATAPGAGGSGGPVYADALDARDGRNGARGEVRVWW